jgi:hypothetical protein
MSAETQMKFGEDKTFKKTLTSMSAPKDNEAPARRLGIEKGKWHR